jgi:hypothetical protein
MRVMLEVVLLLLLGTEAAAAGALPPANAPGPNRDGTGRILSVDVARFAEIHDMTDDEMRARFHLPPSCDPSLSARRMGGDAVDVVMLCVEDRE